MLASNAAIRQRSTVFALMLIIIVVGIYSYVTLPRESTPDITIPYVLVITPYEGVASSDIEIADHQPDRAQAARPQECRRDPLGERRGLVDDHRRVHPRGRHRRCHPVGARQGRPGQGRPARRPGERSADPRSQPRRIPGADGRRLRRRRRRRVLKGVAEELEEHIEEIPGVLDVVLTGGREHEVRVEIDPDRMAAYRVSFNEILTAVAARERQHPRRQHRHRPGQVPAAHPRRVHRPGARSTTW